MARILEIIVLILSLVLFPPATLALISNNAVPGDATYSIKRSLEDMIFTVASVNPTSKAWFAAARSDRRFKEVTILLSKGEQIEQTLDDLVSQTEIAAAQVKEVSDVQKKQQIIKDLSQKIDNYNQVLKDNSTYALADSTQTPPPVPTSSPVAIARFVTSPTPRSIPTPNPTPVKPPSSTPYPVETNLPSPTGSTNVSTPQPTSEPTSVPSADSSTNPTQSEDIKEAIQRLEDIKRRMALDTENKKLQEEKKENKKGEKNEENRRDKSKDNRDRD